MYWLPTMLQALFQVEDYSSEQNRQVFVPRSSQSRGSITKSIKMRQKKKKKVFQEKEMPWKRCRGRQHHSLLEREISLVAAKGLWKEFKEFSHMLYLESSKCCMFELAELVLHLPHSSLGLRRRPLGPEKWRESQHEAQRSQRGWPCRSYFG